MKLSESWLREWVNPNISTQALVDQMTMAGLEVDALEPAAPYFSHVIVGEIIECEQHPDADKLRVCQVKGADATLTQVVCGAPNARVGIKVPFAMVGAELPTPENEKPFKIKKAKLRGVESFGMLCGADELGCDTNANDSKGLWELPDELNTGDDLREALQLNDQVIDVDLTPNRSDCLSILGIARDVGVLNKVSVKTLKEEALKIAPTITDTFDVKLSNAKACPRYGSRIIRGININAPSPLWLKEKLRRSGLRSIDAVVDVTNFVLLEIGQPMHAFDAAKVSQHIDVRMARNEEKITLLDDQEITLADNTLVIADQSGPIAIAGIMGGKTTAVGQHTQDILLESAYFDPITIAGRARQYGLHTDSSHRFERGVDFNLPAKALERATQLLLDIVGGEAGPVATKEDVSCLPANKTVVLRKDRIEKGLGFALSDNDVEDIMTRLGLTIVSPIKASINSNDATNAKEASWTFSIPSYRFDINIEADLLEELARVYGYNNLPTTVMQAPVIMAKNTESLSCEEKLLSHFIARDYQEVVTYSFIDPKLHALFSDSYAIELLNPISQDMSVMRTSLVPGLVSTLQSNLNRQHDRVRIIEKGQRFVPTTESSNNLSKTQQIPTLAGLIYGDRQAISWHKNTAITVDFYDLKGDIESWFESNQQKVVFKPLGELEQKGLAFLHPGQSAAIYVVNNDAETSQDTLVGYLGALHPSIVKSQDLPKVPYLFEMNLELSLNATQPVFQALSRFPEVNRDIAILLGKNIPIKNIEEQIRISAGEFLKNLKVFDIYTGEGIDIQQKSVAFNLTFEHPSRTLKEEEVTAFMTSAVAQLEKAFQAQLR